MQAIWVLIRWHGRRSGRHGLSKATIQLAGPTVSGGPAKEYGAQRHTHNNDKDQVHHQILFSHYRYSPSIGGSRPTQLRGSRARLLIRSYRRSVSSLRHSSVPGVITAAAPEAMP